jgi:hypothetical protein
MRDLSTAALISIVVTRSADAASWPPGSAAALARGDWPSRAAQPLSELARSLEELVKRGEAGSLAPADRDHVIQIYERLYVSLPEALAFFRTFEPAIRKMKIRSAMMRRAAERRAERAAKKLERIELDVHPDDVEALRTYSIELLKKRGITPPAPKRRGRPPKGEDLAPSEADLAAANSPLGGKS